MIDLLRNDKIRVGFLNLSIVLICAAAWVANKWPETTILAILFSVFIVVVELAALYLMALNVRTAATSQRNLASSEPLVSEEPSMEEILAAIRRIIKEDNSSYADLILSEHSKHKNLLPSSTPRISTWKHWPELNQIATMQNIYFSHSPDHFLNWKCYPLAGDAFNVDAGAFTIEHTLGHTFILIRKPDSVTVENGELAELRKQKVSSADIDN